MTPTYLGLLEDIKKNPTNDTLRLIVADYFDDMGGEENTSRAEFIRLQIEQANIAEPCHCGDSVDPTGCSPCRRRFKLYGKTRELFKHWGHEWLGGGVESDVEIEWHRGFPWKLTCPFQRWLDGVGHRFAPFFPLEKVVTPDKKPYLFNQPKSKWIWFIPEEGNWARSYNIQNVGHWAPTIGKFLHGPPCEDYIPCTRTYPTQQAALDDLSSALLRWVSSEPAKGAL